MAHLNSSWVQFLSDVGNQPGAQQGDVVVELAAPVGSLSSITCPSADLSVAVEAGQFIAVHVTLKDGRHLFIPAGNIAGIIDAPVKTGATAETRPPAARKRALPEAGLPVILDW